MPKALRPAVTMPANSIVWSAIFSDDGQTIATACGEHGKGEIRAWSLKGKERARWECEGLVTGVRFAEGDRLLVSADAEGNVRAWEIGERRLRWQKQQRRAVWGIDVHPKKPWVATASDDKTVRLVDLTTGEEVGQPLKHAREVADVQFSPDGKRLIAYTQGKQFTVWQLTGSKRTPLALQHPTSAGAACLAPNGKRLITGCEDRRLRAWNIISGEMEELVQVERGWFEGLHFSPKGDRLYGAISFSSMREKWSEVFAWEMRAGKFRYRHRLHERPATGVSASADGERLLTCSTDKSVLLLDATTGEVLARLPHSASVMGARFHPELPLALTWGGDKAAMLWKL